MSESLGVFKEEGRRRHLLSSRQIVSSSLLSSVHSKVLSFIPGGGGRGSWSGNAQPSSPHTMFETENERQKN